MGISAGEDQLRRVDIGSRQTGAFRRDRTFSDLEGEMKPDTQSAGLFVFRNISGLSFRSGGLIPFGHPGGCSVNGKAR